MVPGTVIAGRFRIERLAGSGGMGAVYRALDQVAGGPVAIKVLHVEKPAEIERFLREARILAEIHHPGVVRYVSHGVAEGGRHYLAIEWLDGVDLTARLFKGGLTPAESVTLAASVAEALAAAHARGVVHRDVKPSNLFLCEGRIDRVKVLDFGIARLGGSMTGHTRTGAMMGTPGYMAPEQARGGRELDARADVFSLGCVLFECLTGRPAFMGEHFMAVLAKILLEDPPRLRSLRPDLPAWLDDLVARMVAKEPGERPRDGAAVAAELCAPGAEPVPMSTSAPPSSAPPPSLTAGEQRLLSVVLAGEGAHDLLGSTVDQGAPGASAEPLRDAVAAQGGRLELLADRSLVATLMGGGSATDQAARAARCALALRALLPPSSPIALATGRGEVGAGPAGEVIDRAARLVRRARGGAPVIHIDEVTAGLLDARFDVGGDARGLLLRAERDPVEATRTLLGKPTPCVGRDREITTLLGIFEECVAEPIARAALVLGPSGVGKSRVCHELLRRLGEGEAARLGAPELSIWVSRGDPVRAGSPFGLLAQALRRAAGMRDGEPLELRRQKIAARVGRHLEGEARRRVTEFLGEIVGAPFPDDDSVQLRAARHDAMLMGDQMRRAFEDFTAAECEAVPLLVLVEDLHWGDLPSVQFLDAALRRLADRPLMVLAVARPEIRDAFPRLWSERNVQEIRLGELTRRAAEKLVRETLGPDLPAETVDRLVARAEGNAFYLEELIRAVAEGRGDELPGTVLAMVQARLERMEPGDRRVHRAASVFGQVFWRGAVAALLGGTLPATSLAEQLAHLAEQEVIARRGESKFAAEEELAFRHALVREAAHATLTDADRLLGHRLAGEWLERAGESEAVVLADHFERGGAPRRAVAWYRRAAEQALGGNDLEAAVARADRGLACGAEGEEVGELMQVRAEALRWRGENAEAEIAALAALDALPAGGTTWLAAMSDAVLTAGRLGHYERLEAIAAQLLVTAAPAGSPTPLISALTRTANQLFFAGRLDVGTRLLAHVANLAGGAALDPNARARMEDSLGTQALCDGDPGGSLAHAEAAVAFSEQAGDLRAACLYRSDLGFAYLEIGAPAEAERVLCEALAAASRMGLDYIVAAARSNLGIAVARRGALAEARAIEAQAVDAFRVQGNRRMEGASLIYLTTILMLGAELDDAERAARAALEVLATTPPAACHALALMASIDLARGRVAEAREASRQAQDLLDELGGLDEGEAFVRLVRAESLHAGGEIEAARVAIGAARDRLRARAERIRDERWRRSFLDNVPENARTLALAEAWARS